MTPPDPDRTRQDPPPPPGKQDAPGAASGGTRTSVGSNYGDWHPNDPHKLRGYDGSARSGDWVKGEKDVADSPETHQELESPTDAKDPKATDGPHKGKAGGPPA